MNNKLVVMELGSVVYNPFDLPLEDLPLVLAHVKPSKKETDGSLHRGALLGENRVFAEVVGQSRLRAREYLGVNNPNAWVHTTLIADYPNGYFFKCVFDNDTEAIELFNRWFMALTGTSWEKER